MSSVAPAVEPVTPERTSGLAAIIEHEAKHVADFISGMDIESPTGCIATEVNAFREEAKTWGELVGPAGKVDPVDELEYSLNVKLALLRQSPDAVEKLILQSSGYRAQCHLRSTIDALAP